MKASPQRHWRKKMRVRTRSIDGSRRILGYPLRSAQASRILMSLLASGPLGREEAGPQDEEQGQREGDGQKPPAGSEAQGSQSPGDPSLRGEGEQHGHHRET